MISISLKGEFMGVTKDLFELFSSCTSGNNSISRLSKKSVFLIQIIQIQNYLKIMMVLRSKYNGSIK